MTPETRAKIDNTIADAGPGFILVGDSDKRLHCAAMAIVHVLAGQVCHADAFTIAQEWRQAAREFAA